MNDWLRIRYFTLLKYFKDKEFTKEEAIKVLEKENQSFSNYDLLFKELEEQGKLIIKEHPEDKRKRIYQLIPYEKILQDQKIEIERKLKEIADNIRGLDYKIILTFLFYKYISDKYEEKVKEYLEGGFDKEEAYEAVNEDFIKLYDEKEKKLYSFNNMEKNFNSLDEGIIESLTKIYELNKEKLEDFDKLINDIKIYLAKEDLIRQFKNLIELISSLDLKNYEGDALGRAYEWYLQLTAQHKNKEGEFFTPVEVSELMAKILNPKGENKFAILDPACGSGTMLLKLTEIAKRNKVNNLIVLGQEKNPLTAVLARMNMIIHEISDAKIFTGDSLINQKFSDYKDLVDYVIANPPWNYKDKNLEDEKEKIKHYALIIPPVKQSLDWLWIQLINYYSKRKAAIVIDQGALFRGGKEKEIRKIFVDKDLIEAVILLPEKLFYNTQAPGVIIILNKNKDEKRKNKILFINASKQFAKHPEVKKLNKLSEKNIETILITYQQFKDLELENNKEGVTLVSKIISIEKIKEKDYNLNVSLYAQIKEYEEEINLEEEFKKFNQLKNKEKLIEKEVNQILKQTIELK